MSVITLTSDWNKNDFYSAAIKGKLLSETGASIVDISHNIGLYNIAQAAFVVGSSFSYFPKNTIHMILVRAELDKNNCLLAAKYRDHYFIASDSGILSLIFEEAPEKLVEIKLSPEQQLDSFPELSHYANAAIAIAKGRKLSDIGSRISNYRQQIRLQPSFDESEIIGNITYIDSYKNAITNIKKDLFEQVAAGRNFTIYVKSNFDRIDRISTFYSESSTGDLLALFNTQGLLEIAIYNGKAAELLNLETNNNIRIKFHDEHNE